ncbi:isochorismatase family cysteine hydrolase [Paludicola sp. MB14-C6]|uniref:cysteine hydrolase family protein n=1 Tax=Paludihabitans sp. MB14-C6 TaxID=3070656 RepID=UPI0027DDD14B|nr:isochorismatase family cysteine hydrolase [Paludicola sp. MB14-C6]WMJ23889.1 isochorismatase family cysteine hydrolase [Paludicola sp. MB14-C6]
MKRLLMVIDFQNDFVDGSLGFENAKNIEEAIVSKIETYHKNGDSVLFTFDTHDETYLNTQEGKNLPILHCIKDSKGWQLYGKPKELLLSTDKIIYKGGFGSLELANYLKAEHYDEIELCGLVSNICVITNAILAKTALPEAKIVVDAKATASFDEQLHLQALNVMKGLQIQVVNEC